MLRLICLVLLVACLTPQTAAVQGEPPANIVYIMSDELAYYELSHMGNPWIETPNIDRMAAEGVRFTHAYAGAPVCAPLRCNLMTGKHAGHASVRANDGGSALRADETTIASLLKGKEYATGGFGKWGCGGRASTGVPEAHGFDVFFGYYDQVHAHSFYPPYLIRNSEEVALEGNIGGRSGETYSHYEIMESALGFIRDNKDRPFFCYLPITPPHGMYDIPADDPAWKLYADAEWMKGEDVSQDVKNYAAMVSMVDRNVGEVLALLKELELDGNTLVVFSGDNGGQDRFSSKEKPRGFFGPNVDPATGVAFRGGKGSLYEGGLRIPFIARWPGTIDPGRVSDLVFYQPDILPTLASLAGADIPSDVDGRSILPTLLGTAEQAPAPFYYWEFGSQIAVRAGDWKGVLRRSGKQSWQTVLESGTGRWELFNVRTDVSESNNVAAENGEVVERMAKIAAAESTPVRPGSYSDPKRVLHKRDRAAKWGTSPDRPAPRKPGPRKTAPVQRIKEADLVPAADMTLVSFSSESSTNNRLAKYAVDGDPKTVWHTNFEGGPKTHPHELVIDLGAETSVRGFRYLARQDAGWNGAFAECEVFLAATPTGFSDAPNASTTFKKTRSAQALDLEMAVRARYVKVRVLSEVNGRAWASAAEFGVVGTQTSTSLPPAYVPQDGDLVIQLAAPDDAKASIGWSPKGAKVSLEARDGVLVGSFPLGPEAAPPVSLELRQSSATSGFDRLALDTDRSGTFEAGEVLITTPTERRGKTWSSFVGSVSLPTKAPSGKPADLDYPLALWFVVNPKDTEAAPVLRWSRTSWMEGKVQHEGEAVAVMLAESVMDGVYDARDSWAVTSELSTGRAREEFRPVDDHNWRGESAWRIVDVHPSGLRVHLRPFDPGVTRAKEKAARDRYAADRRAPVAKEPVPFGHDYETAEAAAKEQRKPLFVDFETTWCGPCKQMDRMVYTKQPVVSAAASVVPVKVDGDARDDLAKRFGVKAYPTMILLDADGKELRRAVGYQSVAQMVEFLSAPVKNDG